MTYEDYPQIFRDLILPTLNPKALYERKLAYEPVRYDKVEEEVYKAICDKIEEIEKNKIRHNWHLIKYARAAGIEVIIKSPNQLN